MVERNFQAKLIKKLKQRYEGCIILKNDPTYIQGIPDLLILYKDRWAALECKRGNKSKHQPNQDYFVKRMNEMSFASFISPENKNDILKNLDAHLRR